MHRRTTIAAAGILLTLTGCGGGEDGGTTGTPVAPTPTAAPTGPPWPSYEPSDYSYVLGTECFCEADRVRVTVRDGEVQSVVYATKGYDHAVGDPVPEDATWLWLSIDDLIDLANDPDIAEAEVRWPADRDHPRWVWIDHDANAIDEEIGYTVTDVHPA